MALFLTSLEQTFLLLPLALGLYLSYCILNATDMTVDGSFVIGAAVFARLLTSNVPIFLCVVAAIIAGAICGVAAGLIQWNQRVDSLIAGILMVFMLYSVNMQVLSKPNIGLYNHDTIIDLIPFSNAEFVMICLFAIISLTIIGLLMSTHLGLLLRAFGSNPFLLGKIGYNRELYRIIGLAIANALAALSGLMTAQINGYADINMGFGIALTGIGAIIIGRQVLLFGQDSFSLLYDLMSCFIGVFIYYLGLNVLLYLGLDPINLKLAIGILLIFFLRTATIRHQNS